ncbi:hypothetical protein OIU34_13605 [Pararhizobium sp. BT-229]|uniref:hypothetical protein n=1 Tax=Pararhizobium sp. BT-229 TaxID=2986923 RepID=UPI0021F6F8B5|nr:hypothetical protein [Pararhizobium sp. BT-229]MCV9962939.1 hypothetical protein [Pararhizobium sp. BT-229]
MSDRAAQPVRRAYKQKIGGCNRFWEKIWLALGKSARAVVRGRPDFASQGVGQKEFGETGLRW